MQAQMIDHIVDARHTDPCANVSRYLQLHTDDHGKADALVPPGARLQVQCMPRIDRPTPAWLQALQRSHQAVLVKPDGEQHVQLAVPLPAALVVTIRDATTQQPVAGCRVRLRVVQDAYGKAVQAHHCPVHDSLETETDASGCTAAFDSCLGAVVHAELLAVPQTYLHLDYLNQAAEQPRTVRLEGQDMLQWVIPRKPRIGVCAHDAASGERVIGVRLRVLAVPRSLQHFAIQPKGTPVQGAATHGTPEAVAEHWRIPDESLRGPDDGAVTLITPGASNDGSPLSLNPSAESSEALCSCTHAAQTGQSPASAPPSARLSLKERLSIAEALWSETKTWEGAHSLLPGVPIHLPVTAIARADFPVVCNAASHAFTCRQNFCWPGVHGLTCMQVTRPAQHSSTSCTRSVTLRPAPHCWWTLATTLWCSCCRCTPSWRSPCAKSGLSWTLAAALPLCSGCAATLRRITSGAGGTCSPRHFGVRTAPQVCRWHRTYVHACVAL